MREKYDIQARFSRIYLFEHIAFKRRPQADFKSAPSAKNNQVCRQRQISLCWQQSVIEKIYPRRSILPR